MHELSIVQEIVRTIEQGLRDAGAAGPVRIVHMTIGKLTAIVPDSVRFYFELITKDTPLEGAKLDIRDMPVAVACADCGRETEVEDINFICPVCGSMNTDIVRGRELFIDSVEVDDGSDG